MSDASDTSNGHGSRLPREQERCIAALLSCRSIKAAAKRAGVGYRTLRGWLDDTTFANSYRRAREAVLEQAIGRLNKLMGRAIATLQKAMRGSDGKAAIRAASVVLTAGVRGAERFEMHRRVTLMEEFVHSVMNPNKAKDPPPPSAPPPQEKTP